jgi:hypothetical protein
MTALFDREVPTSRQVLGLREDDIAHSRHLCHVERPNPSESVYQIFGDPVVGRAREQVPMWSICERLYHVPALIARDI